MSTKIIKGQAWISGDSLVQDETVFTEGQLPGNKTTVLIENIWNDLTSEKGTYKSNAKKTYFYWEVDQNTNDDETVKVMIECPRPKDGLFEPPFDAAQGKGDWAAYWLAKFKTAYNNYQSTATIQPREIVMHGTEYINTQGDIVKVEEKRVTNGDLGDITNLLSLF